MADESIVTTDNAATGAELSGNQAQVEVGKTFTQDELNEIVSKRVAQVKSKYSDIDSNELAELRRFKESMEEEQLIKRQDFESVLKKHRDKSTAEITALRTELERIKIDGALIAAASKLKAVAPEQVAKLLREQVKLTESGQVQIYDGEQPRYNENADPMTVDELVEEFLNSNQYFRSAGPSGTGSQSNTAQPRNQEVNLADLDMMNPKHREIYKKLRAEGKI